MKLPHALDMEQALLGAALFDNKTMARVRVEPSHFYEPSHGVLWAELQARYRAGQAFDPQILREWADRMLAGVGGRTYLATLIANAAPMSGQAVAYADMIRDCASRRATVLAAYQAISAAESGEQDGVSVRADLERRLQEIAAGETDEDAWRSVSSVAASAAERAELGEARGISTGFPSLDAATGGLQRKSLWVAGGATSMGKSVFGAALSRNIAASGAGVAEVHLEMDETQVGLRTTTALSFDADASEFRNPHYLSAMRGSLTGEQWEMLRAAAKKAESLPIFMDNRPGRTIAQIEAAARRLFRNLERQQITPGALVIDHEGLIAPGKDERFPSQLERAAARGEALLAMAKRLDVGVVALAQITNDGARADGDDRLPQVTDIKYGGALTQAASVVILLHRKAYHAERKPKHLRTSEDIRMMQSRDAVLIVDKSRGGMRTQINIQMDMPTAAVWEPRR